MERIDDLHSVVWFVLEITGRLCITEIILRVRHNEHIISQSTTSQNSIGELVKCNAVVPRPMGNEVTMSAIYDLYTSRKPVLMIAMKDTQKQKTIGTSTCQMSAFLTRCFISCLSFIGSVVYVFHIGLLRHVSLVHNVNCICIYLICLGVTFVK